MTREELLQKNPEEINAIVVYHYLDYRRNKQNHSERTCAETKIKLTSIGELAMTNLGVSLLEIDTLFLKTYLSERSAQRLSRATINWDIAAIRSFYKFLYQQSLIPCNPALDIHAIKVYGVEPSLLTQREIDSIMEELNSPDTKLLLRDITMAKMFYYTGITTAELAELRIGKLDLQHDCLRIETGLPKRHRTIPIVPELKKQLEKYLNNWPYRKFSEVTYLFPACNGQRINRSNIHGLMMNILRPTSAKSKGTRTFRNTLAYKLISKGVDLNAVRKLLGRKKLALEGLSVSSVQKQ